VRHIAFPNLRYLRRDIGSKLARRDSALDRLSLPPTFAYVEEGCSLSSKLFSLCFVTSRTLIQCPSLLDCEGTSPRRSGARAYLSILSETSLEPPATHHSLGRVQGSRIRIPGMVANDAKLRRVTRSQSAHTVPGIRSLTSTPLSARRQPTVANHYEKLPQWKFRNQQ